MLSRKSEDRRVVWCTAGGYLYHHAPHTCFNASDRRGMPLEIYALWKEEAIALHREDCTSCEPYEEKNGIRIRVRNDRDAEYQANGREEIEARGGKKPPVRPARRSYDRRYRFR